MNLEHWIVFGTLSVCLLVAHLIVAFCHWFLGRWPLDENGHPYEPFYGWKKAHPGSRYNNPGTRRSRLSYVYLDAISPLYRDNPHARLSWPMLIPLILLS